MRTPFGWTLTSQTPLQVLCACFVLWGMPTAALAAPEQLTPPSVQSTAAPAAVTATPDNSAAHIGGASFNRRALLLLALACLIGLMVGRASRGAREPRVRLLNKPKKTPLSVLVPSRPVPRLIPGDSPHATRPRSTPVPVPRRTPESTTGVIDYLAAFAGSAEGGDKLRVDYLLDSGDDEGQASDPSGGVDGSLPHAE